MLSVDEGRSFYELEKLLWQDRVRESLAGQFLGTEKREDTKTNQDTPVSEND